MASSVHTMVASEAGSDLDSLLIDASDAMQPTGNAIEEHEGVNMAIAHHTEISEPVSMASSMHTLPDCFNDGADVPEDDLSSFLVDAPDPLSDALVAHDLENESANKPQELSQDAAPAEEAAPVEEATTLGKLEIRQVRN